MEERIKLNERTEPKLMRSLIRIAEYYIRASKYITRYLKDYTEEIIYKKDITKLPDSYRTEPRDFVVLRIGKYALENSYLWEGPNGNTDPKLKQMYTNLEVECHIDDRGNVLAVYLAR